MISLLCVQPHDYNSPFSPSHSLPLLPDTLPFCSILYPVLTSFIKTCSTPLQSPVSPNQRRDSSLTRLPKPNTETPRLCGPRNVDYHATPRLPCFLLFRSHSRKRTKPCCRHPADYYLACQTTYLPPALSQPSWMRALFPSCWAFPNSPSRLLQITESSSSNLRATPLLQSPSRTPCS